MTLSVHDITSRKRVELSLVERERFWSDVLRSVPDTLYVHDMSSMRVMFSNNRLGPDLGYSKDELRQFGERLWEKTPTPTMSSCTNACATCRRWWATASCCIASCAGAIAMAAGTGSTSASTP